MKRFILLCMLAVTYTVMASDPIPGASLFSGPEFKEGANWTTALKRTTKLHLTMEYIVAGDNRMQNVDQIQVQEETFKQTVESVNEEGEIVDFTRSYETHSASNQGQAMVASPLQGTTVEVKPKSESQKLLVYKNGDAEKTPVDLDQRLKLKLLDEDQTLPNKVHRTLEDLLTGQEVKEGDTFEVPDKAVANLLDFNNNATSLIKEGTDLKVTIVKITNDEAHLSYTGNISLVIGSNVDPNGRMNFTLTIENWLSVYRRAPFFELKRTVNGKVGLNSIREIGTTIINTGGNGTLSEERSATF